MTAECRPLGWYEGVFHGETAMEVEGWAGEGDFRPAGVTVIHGAMAILSLARDRVYVTLGHERTL